MKLLLRIALPSAIAWIVQGFSSMHWAKPGADPATVSRDLDQCRAQALGRATQSVSLRAASTP